ncbi:unnamed protein product, partial [Discosporangium mesarthrocarpum]
MSRFFCLCLLSATTREQLANDIELGLGLDLSLAVPGRTPWSFELYPLTFLLHCALECFLWLGFYRYISRGGYRTRICLCPFSNPNHPFLMHCTPHFPTELRCVLGIEAFSF